MNNTVDDLMDKHQDQRWRVIGLSIIATTSFGTIFKNGKISNQSEAFVMNLILYEPICSIWMIKMLFFLLVVLG